MSRVEPAAKTFEAPTSGNATDIETEATTSTVAEGSGKSHHIGPGTRAKIAAREKRNATSARIATKDMQAPQYRLPGRLRKWTDRKLDFEKRTNPNSKGQETEYQSRAILGPVAGGGEDILMFKAVQEPGNVVIITQGDHYSDSLSSRAIRMLPAPMRSRALEQVEIYNSKDAIHATSPRAGKRIIFLNYNALENYLKKRW